MLKTRNLGSMVALKADSNGQRALIRQVSSTIMKDLSTDLISPQERIEHVAIVPTYKQNQGTILILLTI